MNITEAKATRLLKRISKDAKDLYAIGAMYPSELATVLLAVEFCEKRICKVAESE